MNEAPQTYQKRDLHRDLLLVVDFQNVYLPGNPWSCCNILSAMENTVDLLRAPCLPETILTRFVPSSHPEGRWREYNHETRQISENALLVQIAEPIRFAATGKTVVEKSTYSAIKCPEVRRAMTGKRSLILSGVVAECCVLSTMMDAIDLGYEVVYLYDCIAGQSAEMERMVRRLAKRFAPVHTQVMSSKDYLSALL